MNAKQMTSINKLTMSSFLSLLRTKYNVVESVRYTTVLVSNESNEDVLFCVNVGVKGKTQIGISFDEMLTITSFNSFTSYRAALEFLQNYTCMSMDNLLFEFNKK
jgi:hypothetical protein